MATKTKDEGPALNAEIILRRLRDAMGEVLATLDEAIASAGALNSAAVHLEAARREEAEVRQAIVATREELRQLEDRARDARAAEAEGEAKGREKLAELDRLAELKRAEAIASEERGAAADRRYEDLTKSFAKLRARAAALVGEDIEATPATA